jgi:hypothetical protein
VYCQHVMWRFSFLFQINRLINCCCRRKKFLQGMSKMIGPCMLLALRDSEAAMEVSHHVLICSHWMQTQIKFWKSISGNSFCYIDLKVPTPHYTPMWRGPTPHYTPMWRGLTPHYTPMWRGRIQINLESATLNSTKMCMRAKDKYRIDREC